MEKKVESAYVYLDYRLLLNDDFILRSDANSRYSLRAYSRDLDISPTFLSEILRGKKELSLQNCRIVFSKIGLDEKEIEYAENLVISKNAKSEVVRSNAFENIKANYMGKEYVHKSSRDLLLQSLPHFIIFGLIRKIDSKRVLIKMTELFRIDKIITENVIKDFLENNYITLEADNIKVLDENFTLKDHEKLIQISNEFSTLLHTQIQLAGGLKVPERVCHAIILGANEETYEMIHEAHKHFLKTIHRLGDQNKHIDKIVFISDSFYAHQLQ